MVGPTPDDPLPRADGIVGKDTQVQPADRIDVSRVAAVMADLAAVADSDPGEARRVLSEVLESVILRLAPDGYVAEVTLRNETAAIAGGRVLEMQVAGARCRAC